jgi:hypothetical protein
MITMKNYNYNVNIYTEDEMTFRTNDVRGALDTFLNAKVQGVHCDLLDGHTGEVLAIANCPDCEDCATPSTMLMIKGMLFESLEGEEIAPEDEEDDSEPVKSEVPVCAVRCDAVPDDLLAFLEQMVAEGRAVKLGS